jgi:hypothetical protein
MFMAFSFRAAEVRAASAEKEANGCRCYRLSAERGEATFL